MIQAHLHELKQLAQYVSSDKEQLQRCGKDETEDLYFEPDVVIEPLNTEEVSAVMQYCYQHTIFVTPRGGGTGLSGGALAVAGGVVLDMRRMNKIIHLDEENFQVTVEPGVITQELQEAVLKKGLFYPPDPASKGSCFIGGNVAENSGGPRAVKYGVVKDYVLNLEVVLPTGEVMWTGAHTLKNATGYNLTQLIIGSEGTLAVVTKIVLRLIAAVKENILLLVPFKSAVEACMAVNDIMRSGVVPSALEFMERDALLFTMSFVDNYSIKIPDEVEAHLLIELDGNNHEILLQQATDISNIITEKYATTDILFADSPSQKTKLWELRRKVGEAVKSQSIYKEEDTVVPRASLPQLLQTIKSIGREYGFQSVCYGHAGDGNLHVNILKGELSNEFWTEQLPLAIRKIFKAVVQMKGTISGEHGIGWVQKSYMDIAYSEKGLQLMKNIKDLFDPKGILNPGKIWMQQ